MGCGASVHPSIYNETHKLNGIKPEKPVKMRVFEDPRHLRGDYSQLQYSRYTRNVQNKERQGKLFVAADEMSGRIIEEREMLSLGERSRGTSRNTSRATSPTQTKKTLQTSEEKKMTPLAESRATSNISNRRSDDMKEMDGVLVGDAKNSDKKVSKAKSKKKQKRSNIKTPKESEQNAVHQDENEELENDSKVNNITEAKTKPKKTSGKQKAKHRKQKKHKKAKTNMVEELTDTEIKDEDDDSDDDRTDRDLNTTKVRDKSNSKGHSDETGNITQPDGNHIILHDITNNDLNVPSDVNVPGSTNHVHFTDELTPHSRSSSVSELDSKRG